MSKYILGVDGGGTKTHCALYDIESQRVDLLEWGTTNHECMQGGYRELETELEKMLEKILSRNGVSPQNLLRCVFGMSGVDTRRQHEAISAIIGSLGINNFLLCNDAFLGVKAGCCNKYGVCAINGSGFSVAGIDRTGRMLQIGGMGNLTGDKGGGSFIVPRSD